MATNRGNTDTTHVAHNRSHGEETKPSFKTTELVVYILVVLGVLIAFNMVGDGTNDDGPDYFAADKGAVVHHPAHHRLHDQPGLAKAGSRSSDTDPAPTDLIRPTGAPVGGQSSHMATHRGSAHRDWHVRAGTRSEGFGRQPPQTCPPARLRTDPGTTPTLSDSGTFSG